MPFNPQFSITLPINKALISIERTRGFLDATEFSEKWLEKLQQKALLLEAHHTTHIEGTHLNLDQSEKILAGEKLPHIDQEDVTELINYTEAFDFVEEHLLSKGKITESLVREIHKLLVKNVRGNNADPGQYRKVQNYVANTKTKKVIYTPPPAYDAPPLMRELLSWINNEKNIPAILIAGIAQFQLLHIHPFLDGNGRCARLLSTLILYKSGYDFKKLFTISEYYDKNRKAYYEAIQQVRESEMDLTGFLEYFTIGLESQMKDLQEKGELSKKLSILFEKHDLSERQKNILELFFEEKPEVTIQDCEKLYPKVSRRSLQRDLSILAEENLIEQQGSKKGVYYKFKL